MLPSKSAVGWDWSGAEKEFERAVALDPNYVTGRHWHAYNLISMGRSAEAIAEIERARQIDPVSLIINTDVGHIYYLARQNDQALAALQKALEMNLSGDPISPYEAERLGLANEVVPDHELFDTALLWARAMAEKAPIAIEQIKSVSAMGELGEGLEAEARGFAKAFTSEDAKEGISAFLGKRKPRFEGK